jgi:hypothetical protein
MTDHIRSVLIRVHLSALLAALCVWLMLQPLSAAARLHVDSRPREAAITIDGKFDDWPGNLEPLGSAPMSIQAVNDGQFLYLRLTASDAATRRQVMRLGLTVWFDPAGGTKKKLGVRYPVVEGGSFDATGRRGGRGRRRGGEGSEGAEPDPGPPLERVDILGPGKDEARSLTRDHLVGVDVAVRSDQGVLDYELKVPLTSSSDRPYALGVEPGRTIGIGIETGKMPQRASGESRGGGFGGGRGGRGGRGGGGQDRDVQPPKPVKVWTLVTLAPAR